MWGVLSSLHLQPLPWIGAILVTMLAAGIDLRTHRIPNWLTAPFFLAALVLSGAGAPGFAGIGNALLGALIAGAPFILLWLIGGGGAGDAKLMLGVGAWLGVTAAVTALAAVAIAGGVVLLVIVVAGGRLRSTILRLRQLALAMPLIVRAGDLDQRREMLELFGSTTSPCEAGATRPVKAQRVPYGPAIFIGTCAAALWMGFAS